MAKRSVAEKAETHERILRHASQAFRAQGSGVGIGEVMKELGLTHGGFYRHFESKDDLLVEAITLSLNEIADRLERVAEKAEEGKRLEAIITAYLSTDHLLHPEVWCALATLAPDIGRQHTNVRKQLDGALQSYMEKLSKYMPGKNGQEQRDNFLILFSGMAGAMAMTRAVGDKGMREHILDLTRRYYLEAFAKSDVMG
jgi:TetR/AcrR family transcriptional regulator, transcriptional repressor for nem operon